MRRALALSLCLAPLAVKAVDHEAVFAPQAPEVDGVADDPAWALAEWRVMDQVMLGETPAPEDFSGRYKLVWTPEALYLMAELHDDVLIDARPDPLYFYWDDDALEIFVDEDASGGLHQFNDNAYAYHVALDNQSVDIGPYESPEAEAAAQVNFQLFNDHVESVWRRQEAAPHAITWEARILLYPEGSDTPARLEAGKLVGFMLAYCDADDPNGRQHFVGDIEIEPVDGDRNRGYIDASVFGRVRLVESLANDPAL